MPLRSHLIGALCAIALPAMAATPDPFHGIYAAFDPATGTQADLVSVEPGVLAPYSFCVSFDGAWHCTEAEELPAPPKGPALFRQDPSVRTLQVEKMGFLMYAPGGATTRVGKTPTGYVAELATNAGYGVHLLTRRAATGGLRKERWRTERGGPTVQVRELNYMGEPVAVAIAPAAQPGQRIELSTVNPYASTPRKCCWGLWPALAGGGEMIVTWRTLPDGPEQSARATLPPTAGLEQLWVIVHADRTAELVLTEERQPGPEGADWPGRVKTPPVAPPAFRKAALARELGVRRQYLAGLVERREAALRADANRAADAEREYVGGEIGLDAMIANERAGVAFLDALAGCDGEQRACMRQAETAARAAARRRD